MGCQGTSKETYKSWNMTEVKEVCQSQRLYHAILYKKTVCQYTTYIPKILFFNLFLSLL